MSSCGLLYLCEDSTESAIYRVPCVNTSDYGQYTAELWNLHCADWKDVESHVDGPIISYFTLRKT